MVPCPWVIDSTTEPAPAPHPCCRLYPLLFVSRRHASPPNGTETNVSSSSASSTTPPTTTASATTAPATTSDLRHQGIHARAACISARHACVPAEGIVDTFDVRVCAAHVRAVCIGAVRARGWQGGDNPMVNCVGGST